jgi:hypothetical protein
VKAPAILQGNEQILHHGRWVDALTLPNFDAAATYQWRTVTGSDYGRAIRAARAEPANPLSAALKAARRRAP